MAPTNSASAAATSNFFSALDMATDRGNAYNAPDPCSESLEKMTKRLTSDLRARVRRLAQYPPLSPEWVAMADTLQHLASVAMMEEKDNSSKKDAGSIWERDELCVRYIIEEGKINMLMRSMNDFKTHQYQKGAEKVFQDEKRVSMKVFEQSLGILLRSAFGAVEALQTLDLTHVVEHIAMVLRQSVGAYEPTLGDANCQEYLVITYLDLIFRKIDALSSQDAVMKHLEEHDIVPLVLSHFEKFVPFTDKEFRSRYAYFLAHLMETEAYQTHRAKYLPDSATKKRLVLLEGTVKELLTTDPDNRKALRTLSDNIIRCK